jgi:protoporphyrin/coproporphyrin ferrochelatase
MAYGTADGPDDIERYYTDIRGGRPPSPEHLEELRDRYAAIGDRFPLLEITRRQAEGLQDTLNAREPGPFRAYIGMKHSPPWIADAVADMRADGIRRAVGIVMAPHWSAMSIPTYQERVEAALGEAEAPLFTFVRSYHDHPAFIRLLVERLHDALATLPSSVRDEALVVFTAHSLPVRTAHDGAFRCLSCADGVCAASCRYLDGLRETADLVAGAAGLGSWTIAWQSAGRTADPWWGPGVEDVIRELGGSATPGVVVCSAGFVADHLEILFDLDVEARAIAERAGIAFARTEMPNADPAFVAMLADVVAAHLGQNAPA